MSMQFQSGPATGGEVVTPSDSTVLPPTRALWVGGAGNINVVMDDGTTLLLSGVPAGSLMPLSVTKVMFTSTTATNIVALR